MIYKVSVCVPVYNAQLYLEECIQSLIGQTLKDIQLIFVNDGSTDKSKSILDKYKKQYKNIVIIDQENQGLGGARNTALKYVEGEYVGFVDADDFVDVEMFEKLYDTAKTKHAEMVISNMSFYPIDKRGRKKWFNRYDGKIDAKFLHKNTQPWNKIVLNSVIQQLNFKFYEKNGDGQYIILMLHVNKIVTIDDELYFYRVGHKSMSTDFNVEYFLISIESCKRQIELLKKTKYENQLKEYFDYRMINILLQTQAVAALKNNRSVFMNCKNKLNRMNYRSNIYMKLLLFPEYGKIKYFGMTRIQNISFIFTRASVTTLTFLGKF